MKTLLQVVSRNYISITKMVTPPAYEISRFTKIISVASGALLIKWSYKRKTKPNRVCIKENKSLSKETGQEKLKK